MSMLLDAARVPWPKSSRRNFLRQIAGLGIAVCHRPISRQLLAAEPHLPLGTALKFPGPWQFLLPKASIILVSDQQLEDLQDPDKPVDLSLSTTPNVTTLRKICEGAKAQGARTLILAFDEFWTQYRKGQSGKPREFLPDTEDYVQRLARISQTVKPYGLGFELSLLSPLEIGRGYEKATAQSGRWIQYREGYRAAGTGQYNVALWEQRRWTNNKGTIDLKRLGIRVLAFQERRIGGTNFYRVDPDAIVELKTAPEVEVDDSDLPSTHARRLMIRGRGDTDVGKLDRVMVLVSYGTPELDYFSPKALPFLKGLVERYHQAGVPLNGLYADEMHIQQDWGYFTHHDEGQFAFRYLTPNLALRFAELYGNEYQDLEKFLVYFCYGQHGFLPNLEARLPAQHVLGDGPEKIQQTFLLRRRYYDLLENTVVDLFSDAKRFAEEKYGQELESRAHATWAQSPTCDAWERGNQPLPSRQYEYTPEFLWSNTVQQASSACSDYFAWNKFLTGGGNDHAEGGWLDRNYYGIALACSTGILNRTPYAYAAAWGMPDPVQVRHQAVCDAFGASANPWFQAVQDSQHRDTDVLMLYPLSLVACEERFGSWMVQYGYANYVTPRKLIEHGRVTPDGHIEIKGRRFGTVAILFEPFPLPGLLELLFQFARQGGKLIWSGPPPRLDFAGNGVLDEWKQMFGIKDLKFGIEGQFAGGWEAGFSGVLQNVPSQRILTDFLVDLVYPVELETNTEPVARLGQKIVGAHRRLANGGTATYLGFRPRDDQSASLGAEVRTWFELLNALQAYPNIGKLALAPDNPEVISRTTNYVSCRFPNGTTTVGVHYRSFEENWPGGFHRDGKQDAEILARNPLPSARLDLRDFRVNGHEVTYDGSLVVAFRMAADGGLLGFAGHECRKIRIDGREFIFAEEPVSLAAWSPVLPDRRVPGGAVLELWAQGDTQMQIPLPPAVTNGELYLEGALPGTFGQRVACECAEGTLRFKISDGASRKHLFFKT